MPVVSNRSGLSILLAEAKVLGACYWTLVHLWSRSARGPLDFLHQGRVEHADELILLGGKGGHRIAVWSECQVCGIWGDRDGKGQQFPPQSQIPMPRKLAEPSFLGLLSIRGAAQALSVYLYLRGGMLSVWGWELLLQSRYHLTSPGSKQKLVAAAQETTDFTPRFFR